jgi:hypothetical protein
MGPSDVGRITAQSCAAWRHACCIIRRRKLLACASPSASRSGRSDSSCRWRYKSVRRRRSSGHRRRSSGHRTRNQPRHQPQQRHSSRICHSLIDRSLIHHNYHIRHSDLRRVCSSRANCYRNSPQRRGYRKNRHGEDRRDGGCRRHGVGRHREAGRDGEGRPSAGRADLGTRTRKSKARRCRSQRQSRENEVGSTQHDELPC